MNIRKTVAGLLAEILSADPLDMEKSFRLTPENDVAPIDVAKLAIACEGAFHLTLHDEKIAQWETLGDVCRQLAELIEEGQAEQTERSDEDRTAWYYE